MVAKWVELGREHVLSELVKRRHSVMD
jgi:hypothetical protein